MPKKNDLPNIFWRACASSRPPVLVLHLNLPRKMHGTQSGGSNDIQNRTSVYNPAFLICCLFLCLSTMTNKITLPPISDIFNKNVQPTPQRGPSYSVVPVYAYHYAYGSYPPSYSTQPSSYSLYNHGSYTPYSREAPSGSLSLEAPSPVSQPLTAAATRRSLVSTRRESFDLPTLPGSPVSKSASPDLSHSRTRTRNNLPKETTYILLKWLNDHLNHPYPNSFEKTQLMMTTGLNQQQLSNWFINARRRKIKVLRQKQKTSS